MKTEPEVPKKQSPAETAAYAAGVDYGLRLAIAAYASFPPAMRLNAATATETIESLRKHWRDSAALPSEPMVDPTVEARHHVREALDALDSAVEEVGEASRLLSVCCEKEFGGK